MNKKLSVLAIVAAVAGVPAAQAAENFYVAGNIGGSFARDADMGNPSATMTFNNGYLFSGAFGYKFNGGFRLETEASYRKHDLDKLAGVAANGDVTIRSMMVNGVFDFDTGTGWSPYLGLGVGTANVDYNGSTLNASGSDYAYQILAGFGVDLGSGTTLDVGYRYFDPNKVTLDGVRTSDNSSHDVQVGLRFTF